MAKLMTDGIIDGGLDKIALCTNLTVCAGQPVSYADIATKSLATATLTGVDFTIANGDTSGRKATVASQVDMTIDTSGTADHVAIDDGVGEYLITTITASQALTAGGTITSSAFDSEIADPV